MVTYGEYMLSSGFHKAFLTCGKCGNTQEYWISSKGIKEHICHMCRGASMNENIQW